MDHLERSLLNYFTLQPLDRVAHQRCDDEWLQSIRVHPTSSYYLLHGDKVITRSGKPILATHQQLTSLNLDEQPYNFLGIENSHSHFSLNIEHLDAIKQHFNQIELKSLRDLADEIDMKHASILAYGQLMNHWQLTNRFCRRCGASYQSEQGGHVLKCSSTTCSHTEFPRINPAVIMRVTHGDKILLGRQPNWPENRYSVLAGFVETGETLEHAVKREIKEEAGIDVEQIYYHSSQPWPFPNSLMIGYVAEAKSLDLDIEKDDLETAIWLNADELTSCMDERSVILSPPISISHRLIEDWFLEQTGRSIKEWQQIKPEHIVHENE